jgi:TonB-dependent starch-binding outer membrane protein SusC
MGFCFLLVMQSIAQVRISGKVTDPEGNPIPGVNILVKGTNNGTVTDGNGVYNIEAPSDATFLFSFIGFKPLERAVGGQSIIDVVLEEDILSLEEIVVVGYGVQKKTVATASVSTVDSKGLQGFSSARVDQMLQGQVAGVTFKTSSGQPGSGQNIFIRGIGTNGDNSPLIIIDGVNSNDGFLASLNPADIESVQILKDGASTAIYGARAANGIIMVTTKKAKAGEARLNYSMFYGVQKPWRTPEMMNAEQYVALINEKYDNAGLTPRAGFPRVGDPITNNTNWMEEIFEPASTQTHNLSLSQGSEKGSVFASLSYFDQKGVIAPSKSNAKRLTFRLNADQTVNKYVSFGQNVTIAHSSNERIPENNVFGSPISDAFVYDPTTPVFDENGTFGFAQSPWVQKEYLNPLSRIFINNSRTSQDGILGNFFIKLNPLKNLTLKSDIGVDYNYYNGKGFAPTYSFKDTNGGTLPLENVQNDIGTYTANVFIWQWETYGTYDIKKGSHNVQLTAGTTARKRTETGFSATSSGIPEEVQFNPDFQYISATPDSSRLSDDATLPVETLASVFGRVNYNFDERYLFTATLRRDGSSKFGANNRYGIFPSVSAGWVVSKENFWSVPAISFLKLRASYGVNGSDRIPNLRYASLIGLTGQYQFGKPGNQIVVPGQSELYLPNPSLRWEESKQLDIGIEFGLLNDNLQIELDYYRKTTSGLLMPQTISIISGNAAPIANVGEAVNKGIEIQAKYNKRFGDVNFNATFNLATLKNEATVVSDGFINGYTWPIRNTPITRMELGQPIGFFRGFKTGGVFRDESDIFAYINADGDPIQPNAVPGDLKFVDVNNDGKIDDLDIVNIGKPWADLTMGLTLGADWKGIDVRMLFAASIGNDIFRSYERQDVPENNYQVEWLDRWSETNPGGSYPRVTINDTNNNARPSDFYVEDGSYLRLKNIQIGYTLPTAIARKAMLQTLRVYTSFDNLITLTGYSGFDPEIGVGGSILDTAIDKGFYPQLKTVGFGLSATF